MAKTDYFKQNLLKPKNLLRQFEEVGSDQQKLTQLLSQFGLSTPQKLLAFLHSPAGKIVDALLEKQALAEIESLEEYEQKQAEDNDFKQHFGLYLMLALLYEQAEVKETLKENYERMRLGLEKPHHGDTDEIQQSYQNALAAVERALITQQRQLLALEQKSLELEDNLTEISQTNNVSQSSLANIPKKQIVHKIGKNNYEQIKLKSQLDKLMHQKTLLENKISALKRTPSLEPKALQVKPPLSKPSDTQISKARVLSYPDLNRLISGKIDSELPCRKAPKAYQ